MKNLVTSHGEELFSSQNNRTENIKFSTYDGCI